MISTSSTEGSRTPLARLPAPSWSLRTSHTNLSLPITPSNRDLAILSMINSVLRSSTYLSMSVKMVTLITAIKRKLTMLDSLLKQPRDSLSVSQLCTLTLADLALSALLTHASTSMTTLNCISQRTSTSSVLPSVTSPRLPTSLSPTVT